jgi:DNA-directed RNA polymerase subunit E'/Rpb7
MDTRRWGPGERIVFEPYTQEVFDDMIEWVSEHGIFAEGNLGSRQYETSVLRLMS